MIKTGLAGPYPLTFDGISGTVLRQSAGAYAIGYIDANGRFCINHVGRADGDIKARLCELIGTDLMFKYNYLPSSKVAFEKECELYHDFRPHGNRLHPSRPSGASWECPRCRFFGSMKTATR